MGKGDVKSKKGKRAKGSFGKSRPHKQKRAEKTATPEKNAAAKK